MLTKKISEEEWIRINQTTCNFCKNIKQIKDIDEENQNFIPENPVSIVFDLKSKKYWLWFFDEYINDKIIYSTYSYPPIKYCPVCGKLL